MIVLSACDVRCWLLVVRSKFLKMNGIGEQQTPDSDGAKYNLLIIDKIMLRVKA